MVSNLDAEQFALLFIGKSNTYVRNELPKTKPEGSDKIKTKITNNEGKVDKELLSHHLEGDFGVGICPVDSEGKCHFAVLDIDCYDKRLSKLLYFIREYQLPLLPFRSKSGGIHAYIFFRKAVTAKSAREILGQFIYYFGLDRIYGKTKVEIFPKQEKAEGFGSAITLPYFNCESPYTYLMDLDGNAVGMHDAFDIIRKKLVTVDSIKAVFSSLPYGDAPPCIQRILISESVGGEDTGRNNFLYSYAIYAKKKYNSGFEDYVKEINSSFDVPLEDSAVESLINSVKNNEYIYKCHDIPCNDFCNKSECRKHEFGLGRDKGHFTGIDYGQILRIKTAEPHYIWKLRLNGQEVWKDVIFKDEGYLLDQKNFAKMCIRYLNNAPMLVSANDWNATLNSVLPNIQDVEVKEESDTSALSALRSSFIEYLTNKQAKRDTPYQIRVGLTVYQSCNGVSKYYFTHRGFYDYLKNHKISFDASTMRETLKNFGAKEDILNYTNASGKTVSFPCWSREDDDELQDAFAGNIEIEEGDKASLGNIEAMGEASSVEAFENKTEEKPYTDKDMQEAIDLF